MAQTNPGLLNCILPAEEMILNMQIQLFPRKKTKETFRIQDGDHGTSLPEKIAKTCYIIWG
jgi:hypothetical protein